MSSPKKDTGFAIALAWPQTYCKQPGSWYDPLTLWLGINKNNYYKIGHAAIVLVDIENKKCHYFDFGRYHSPFQYGRVRSVETDFDLEIKTTPVISADNKSIINFREIISELQLNTACHGEGKIYASYCYINFLSAFNKALQMQQASPISYGPFQYKGSNCSRFVNTVILAGKPRLKSIIRLKYFVPLTPTPLNNVKSLDHSLILPDLVNVVPFPAVQRLDKKLIKKTLKQPVRNPNIPANAQWLGGEGAGSWFGFKFAKSLLKVTRYSPEGVIECFGLFKNSTGENIIYDQKFLVTYPSNCKVITLTQANRNLMFMRASI